MNRNHAFSRGITFDSQPSGWKEKIYAFLGKYIRTFIDSYDRMDVMKQFSAHAKIGSGVRFSAEAWVVNFGKPENVRIGDRTICKGLLRVADFGPAQLDIGHGVYIGDSVLISCTQKISIGDYSLLAHNVEVFDNDSHPVSGKARERDWKIVLGEESGNRNDIQSAQVKIGSRVWIGANSLVLKGVTIGDGSIVAAGSVVVSDIPSHVIAAGNPAKVLKSISD